MDSPLRSESSDISLEYSGELISPIENLKDAILKCNADACKKWSKKISDLHLHAAAPLLLTLAVEQGDLKIIQILLNAGLDPDAVSINEMTVRQLAEKTHDSALIYLFETHTHQIKFKKIIYTKSCILTFHSSPQPRLSDPSERTHSASFTTNFFLTNNCPLLLEVFLFNQGPLPQEVVIRLGITRFIDVKGGTCYEISLIHVPHTSYDLKILPLNYTFFNHPQHPNVICERRDNLVKKKPPKPCIIS